jgi:DNA-binding transcriptional MocR family regulator
MDDARTSVMRHFPAGTKCTQPEGGYFLWVEMPEEIDSYALHRAALAKGISVAPGMLFTLGDELSNCLRLNCSFPSEQVGEAVAVLDELASDLRV